MREMRVAAVGVSTPGDHPLVLLQERHGRARIMPIWIGPSEATTIELERNHLATPRPVTHALIAAVINACDRALLRVCLTELVNNQYHAELVCDHDVRISARPSDAIALALHTGVPIMAEDSLVDRTGLEPRLVLEVGPADLPTPATTLDDIRHDPAEHTDVLEQFRRFLTDATPEDFNTDE
jgi:hypothetical protein